jgi:predicted acylesterase/phospholipase RssA
MRDSTLAALPRAAYEREIARHPAMVTHLARMIVGRMTATQARGAARAEARTVAIVPLHPGIDATAFCRRLRLSLLHAGPTALVDGAVLARQGAGADELAQDRWLDECERRHDYVLLQADATATPWTRKCLGYADRVLLVADAREDPRPTALERGALAEARLRAAPELVILHHGDGNPAGTARWLGGRRVERHHHVALAGSPGFNRLARFLSGRAVALVLAGGGARGFAHLGVIRALREAGVPIDAVGGTSFGAIAATGPARGYQTEHMIEELRHAFTAERPLDDFTVPIVSLVRGERLDRLLERYLDMDIEDLWIPYFAVSSNLSLNRVQVHDRGRLARAVRASVSLPAILPPVVHDGDLLVDGGVLNNLPVDVMRERVRGRIIAVDLSVEHEYRLGHDAVPSGLDYLKSRLLPGAKPVEAPTLARVIMKTTTLASRREVQLARKAADLYLNVPLAQFDLLDWGRFHAIVDVGYRHACDALAGYLAANPDLVQRETLFDAAPLAA